MSTSVAFFMATSYKNTNFRYKIKTKQTEKIQQTFTDLLQYIYLKFTVFCFVFNNSRIGKHKMFSVKTSNSYQPQTFEW